MALLVVALPVNTKLSLLQTPFWQQSGVGPLSQHGLAPHTSGVVVSGGVVVVTGISHLKSNPVTRLQILFSASQDSWPPLKSQASAAK